MARENIFETYTGATPEEEEQLRIARENFNMVPSYVERFSIQDIGARVLFPAAWDEEMSNADFEAMTDQAERDCARHVINE